MWDVVQMCGVFRVHQHRPQQPILDLGTELGGLSASIPLEHIEWSIIYDRGG